MVYKQSNLKTKLTMPTVRLTFCFSKGRFRLIVGPSPAVFPGFNLIQQPSPVVLELRRIRYGPVATMGGLEASASEVVFRL